MIDEPAEDAAAPAAAAGNWGACEMARNVRIVTVDGHSIRVHQWVKIGQLCLMVTDRW